MPSVLSRSAARDSGQTRYFTGRPCKRGHIAERHVSGSQCTECHASHASSWQSSAHGKATRKRRYNEDIDRRRQYGRNYTRARRDASARRARPIECELCGRPPGKGSLHYDHCHKTGKFRGWLCAGCNTGIGKLGDDVAGLRRAIDYLERADTEIRDTLDRRRKRR